MEETEIRIFENPMFGEIRVAGTTDNPMFCLADLCRVLELQVTPTQNRLDPRGVNSIKVSTPIVSQRKDTGCTNYQQFTERKRKSNMKVRIELEVEMNGEYNEKDVKDYFAYIYLTITTTLMAKVFFLTKE